MEGYFQLAISLCTVYATTAGSPYVYWNFMVCTVHMGDNDMRKLHPHTKLVSTFM